MHVHYYQEEALTVAEGRIGYQRTGQVAGGRLLGRYRKYADAPEPVRR